MLGYGNASQALASHVDDEDRATLQILETGQKRTKAVINESGVYALIFGSKLPAARAQLTTMSGRR